MREFRIEISGYAPYPMTEAYIEKAGKPHVAVARAMKKFEDMISSKGKAQKFSHSNTNVKVSFPML